jgi:O-antigen ligase
VADLPVLLAGVTVSAALLMPTGKARVCPVDWAVLLVLPYEARSLLVSRYPANGLLSVKTVCIVVLCYVLVRLAIRTTQQAVAVALLVGTGGVVLAWQALSQASDQIHALRAVWFSDIVAFRWRVIGPPASWVLGEWFTLVLLTLPFAFAIPAFLWLGRGRKLAVGAALVPALISSALLLSCSRAVFTGMVVFVVTVVGLATVFRVVRLKAAGFLVGGAFCVLGLILIAENAVYPGIAEAYTGRHTSQVRSTEGRLAIWKRSVDVFALSPWWGVGSGNAPLFLASSADQEETTGFASRTFSLPIQILVEKGIVGAAIYVVVLVLAGWEAHRKLRSPKVSPQMKGMTCCFAAGVIAVLSRELTYSSLFEHAATAMLFAMCLALLVNPEEA